MRPIDYKHWYTEASTYVRNLTSFYVHLPRDENESLRWRAVLSPILATTTTAYIYTDDPLPPACPPLLYLPTLRNKRAQLNTQKECVVGFEDFWKSKDDARGTIVL